MQLSGGLDLWNRIEVGHHRELFAPPEQRAGPAVSHDLFRQPGMRNNRKAHVREVRGLMGEDTQVGMARGTGAVPQLVYDAAPKTFSASRLTDHKRTNFGNRGTEWRELSACDDGAASVDGDHEAIDARCQFTQLAGQKMTRLLILLNQRVNFLCIAPDSRPKLRYATADLKVGTTYIVPGFGPATLWLAHVVAPANTSLNAASSSPIARSSSASVMISGGNNRITVPAVRFTSTPCRMAASYTGAASMFSSRPHMRPAPRMSTIAGCFFCMSRSFPSRCAPVFFTCSIKPAVS